MTATDAAPPAVSGEPGASAADVAAAAPAPAVADVAMPVVSATGDVAVPRRQPGDPHPYMLQRNPPNLWFLAVMTAIALAVALVVMLLTVWL